MEVDIRKARPADIPAIHDLVRELASYERGLDKVTTTPESYIKDFQDHVFDAFVAEIDGEVVGMALYFLVFSTWRGRMLYLEDFIVKESARGQGLGALLFEALIAEAKSQNASLIKCQVLKWNEPAINFYRKYDVEFDDEWLDGKIFL